MKSSLFKVFATIALATVQAGCNSGNPNPPTFNASLSATNVQFSVNQGGTTSGYVYFSNAVHETIASNPDGLSGATLNAANGLLTLSPPVNQQPGLYYLGIYADNNNGTVSKTAVVNLTPQGQPDTPQVVPFSMSGYGRQRAVITVFDARNEMNGTLGLKITLPDGSSAANSGVTVNAIEPVLVGGTHAYRINADLTVDLSQLKTTPITAADGQHYTDGIVLQFSATPTTVEGYTYAPYTERFYLRPLQ